MNGETYGAKCMRCTHIRHDRRRSSLSAPDPLPVWIGPPPSGLQCRDCEDCANDTLHALLVANGGIDLFSPETRDMVKAFREGRDHPGLDHLRAECQALEQVVDFMGGRWRVVDAQLDESEHGSHWHLTLTPARVEASA